MIAHSYMAEVRGPDGPVKLVIETFVLDSNSVSYGRRKLADWALKWRADYVLWLDADMTFPPSALLQLLSHGQPVVGANCRRRTVGSIDPTAVKTVDGQARPVAPAETGLEPVDHTGLAVCLVEGRVLAALKQPMFVEVAAPDGIGKIGSDTHFFRLVRDAGFPIHIDHSLSMEVGHIAETVLRFPH